MLPLGVYGGLTRTHAITGNVNTSDAYNKGNTAGCKDAGGVTLTTDQRGFTRPLDGRCDIGAFEAKRCGNGVAEDAEQCDDGNTINGDGCNAACFTEVPGNHNEPATAGATTGDLVTSYADCTTQSQSTLAPPAFVTFACTPARTDIGCGFTTTTTSGVNGTYKVAPTTAKDDVRVEIHLNKLDVTGTSACINAKLGAFVTFNETAVLCAGQTSCTRKTQQMTDIYVGNCTVSAAGNCDINVLMSDVVERYVPGKRTGIEIRSVKVKRCTNGACNAPAHFGVTSFVPGLFLP